MFNYLQRNIYVFNRAKVNDGMLPIFALPPDFFRVRAKYIFSFLLGVLKQKDCFSWIFDLKKQTAMYFLEYFYKVSLKLFQTLMENWNHNLQNHKN